MHHRPLGDSGLTVSAVGLGSWLTYGTGVAREQAEACTRAAVEAGVRFFDTANSYGQGAAERTWGEILSAYPRDSYVLATKVFFPMGSRDRGLSRKQIHKQLDASLERLNTDYIDLYQCHRYDDRTPLTETMGALTDVVKAGKARAIGFSEWPLPRVQDALRLPGVARFTSSQPQYSLLHRDPEAAVIPLCAANGIGQVVWSPLAQGVLTGKYRPGQAPPDGSRAAAHGGHHGIGSLLTERNLARVERLRHVAEEAGLPLSRLALAWVLRPEAGIAAAIVGATRPEQVRENAAAADVTLSDDVLEAIEAALAEPAAV